MQEDLVSIVLPVYNSCQFLEDCLNSLREQTYKNIEIICIDDGSTDDSLSILNKYKSLDNRIIVVTQDNKGQSIARNIGIKMSKGRYINFTDSDDLIEPETIEICVNYIKSKHVDAVYYNMEVFTPTSKFISFKGDNFKPSNTVLDTKKDEICINFTNAAPALFDNQIIKENHLCFPENMLYEDWVFMAKFNIFASKIYWYDSPFYKYRRDFIKTSTNVITEKCLDLFKAYEMADALIENAGLTSLYAHINDAKIINESICFLECNLLASEEYEVKKAFILNIQKLLNNYPKSYILSLTPHIHCNNTLLKLIGQKKETLLFPKYASNYTKHLENLNKINKWIIKDLRQWLSEIISLTYYFFKIGLGIK